MIFPRWKQNRSVYVDKLNYPLLKLSIVYEEKSSFPIIDVNSIYE